jgi:vitamin B12 transporter
MPTRTKPLSALLRAFLTSLFFLLPTFAQSSGAVSGVVADATGAVIVGAHATLIDRDHGLQKTTTTNANGEYRFAATAPGTYILRIEAVGFQASVQTLAVSGPETRNVQLGVVQASDIVIVTASGSPQTVDEISKAATVVDAQEIALRNEFSISESLRNTPGLRIRQAGGPGTFTQIFTRGLRSADTAVLVDGLRLRDVAAINGDATSFISELFVVNPSRIETLRGSGSSLYGTNAIGGVVNIIGDQGGGATHGQVQLEGGTLGLFRGRAQLAGGFLNDRLVYSAGVAHLNVSDGVNGDTPTRSVSGQGFARYNFTPSASLSGRVLGNTSFLAINGNPLIAPGAALPTAGIVSAAPLSLAQLRQFENGRTFALGNANLIPNFRDPSNRRDSGFISAATTFTQRLNETVGYRVSYQGVTTDREFGAGPGGVSVPEAFLFPRAFASANFFNGRTDTLNAQTDIRLGQFHLITAGYEFERERYDNLNTDQNPVADFRTNDRTFITQRSNTFFIQDQMRFFSDRLQVSAAFRTQFFNLSQPKFSGLTNPYAGVTLTRPDNAYTGDGSILYFFRQTGTKLRAHVGNGYRAPSPFERFGNSLFGNFGDPRLRSERSIAADGGFDQTLFNNRVKVSATYFYTRLQEVIDFLPVARPDPFGRMSGFGNTNGGVARGVEIGFEVRPTRTTTLSGSYTYTNSDNRRPVAGTVRAFNITENMFGLTATQLIGKRLDVTFDVFAASDYLFPFFDSNTFATRAFRFAGPKKADIVVGYTQPFGERSVRFYAKVENFTDQKIFEGGFRAPGATFVGGGTFRF